MVFSDDFLHFLKIKKKSCWIHQNYIVALICDFNDNPDTYLIQNDEDDVETRQEGVL